MNYSQHTELIRNLNKITKKSFNLFYCTYPSHQFWVGHCLHNFRIFLYTQPTFTNKLVTKSYK